MKVQEIDIQSEYYPKRLLKIERPPQKLYVLGNIDILNDKGIAIVGSRDCTSEGIKNAENFAMNIAKNGFTIISGMAKGIDGAAHRGAMEVGGKTIAVLGCGVDVIYPMENKKIYERIIKTGGTIISEYENGTNTQSEFFRQRNRIVSGLSMGVLVVEAEARSGTTITVGYAKEQGKPVFCIPNSLKNRKGVGTNILIQKGAKMVISPMEIIERYKLKDIQQVSIEDLEKIKMEESIDNIKEEYRDIYIGIRDNLSIDEISAKNKIDITDIYSKLFMMELDGIIKKDGNKYICISEGKDM